MAGDQPASERSFTPLDFVLLAGLAPAAFLLPFVLGRNGFLLFDFSLVVDAGWRILNGQLPHVDFVLPSGPVCFMLQALFFKVFGANLHAPLIHAGTVNALAALLVFWIVKRESNTLLALMGSLATAAWFYVPYPFPWYDTTAFFFVLLAQAVYALRIRPKANSPGRWSFLIGVLVGAAFLSKQNIGLFAALLYAVLLWAAAGLQKPGRALILGLGLLAVVGGYLLFNTLMGGGAGTIEGLFVRPCLMGRGGKMLAARTWLTALNAWPVRLLAAFFLLALLHAGRRRPRLLRLRLSGDLTGLLLLCLLAAATGTAPKYIFLPFLGLCMGLFSGRYVVHPVTGGPGAVQANVFRASGMGGFKGGIILVLFLLATMWGVRVGTSRVAKTYALKRCGFQTGFALENEVLRPFTMDEKLGSALDRALHELKARDAAGEGFYVFPNASVLYMAMDYVSPIPYVWLHPGQSFFQEALDDDQRLVDALEESAPEWVVLWDDYQFNFDRSELIYFMPRLKAYIEERYEPDLETMEFRILRRKP